MTARDSNRPPTIYLLFGTDDVELDKTVSHLRSSMGEASLADLNLTRFQGRNVPLADLQAACLAAPFLVRRRLVLVEGWLADRPGRAEEAETETSGGEVPLEAEPAVAGEVSADQESAPEEEPHARDWDAVCSLLGQVPASTALVLVERGVLRKDHPILTWCKAHPDRALVRSFKVPQGAGLPAWIARRAEELGGSMDPPAARLLASLVGEDPRVLDQEVQKLLAYVNYARPIHSQDVEEITPESLQLDIFKMVDAVAQRDRHTAVDLLHDLLIKRRPEGVLGMLVRQFRLLIQVREGLEAQRSTQELFDELKLSNWLREKLLRQARGFPLGTLEAIYRKLVGFDEALKTSRVDAETGFDVLLEEVMRAVGETGT